MPTSIMAHHFLTRTMPLSPPTPTFLSSSSPSSSGEAGHHPPSFLMEKSRSFPEYSASYVGFDYEDRTSSYSFNGPNDKAGGFSTSGDPELKRKKRIAAYNSYVMENKLKSSVRNSFKWIKSKFTDVRYG